MRLFVLHGNEREGFILQDTHTGGAIAAAHCNNKGDAFIQLWLNKRKDIQSMIGSDIDVAWLSDTKITVEDLRLKNKRWAESQLGGN